MRVDWVHPSWRDLVIEELAEDAETRRHFLARCGVDGAAIALSGSGGAEGARERPLLREDADWDALGDGLYSLCHDTRRGRGDPAAPRARRRRRRRRGAGADRARAQAAALGGPGDLRRRAHRLGAGREQARPAPRAAGGDDDVARARAARRPGRAAGTRALRGLAAAGRTAARARPRDARQARLPRPLRGGPRSVRGPQPAQRAGARARVADRDALPARHARSGAGGTRR